MKNINKFLNEIYYYGLKSNIVLRDLKIGFKYANGCGTKLTWWIPDTILGVSITTACNIHDIETQLAKSLDDLHLSSKTFYDNMQKIIKIKSLFLYYPRILIAKIYVAAIDNLWLNDYAETRNFE